MKTAYITKLINDPRGLAIVINAPAKARSLSANQTLAVKLIAFRYIGAAAMTIICPMITKPNQSFIAAKRRNQLPMIIMVDAILSTVLLLNFEYRNVVRMFIGMKLI